jgi:hypothetical protein
MAQKVVKLKPGQTQRSVTISKILTKYLKKYPDMKDYTLAKLVYTENSHLFKDLEAVRSNIRRRRNHHGKNVMVIDTSFYKPKNYDTTNTPIKLINKSPKLKIFTLPIGIKNVLFLSDIHLPYQDDIALNLAIKYGIDNNVDCVWLNGDILDMYGASSHEKLPNNAMVLEEFQVAQEFFTQLRVAFPKATIYYKEGNHERRWLRLLMRKAPEIMGCPEFELPVILKLAEHKIIWIENETLSKFGDLNVIHGNEFRGAGGINPARALWMRARANAIAGDKHKTHENIETDLNNHLTKVYSVGCLCDLNPQYMPFAHTIWNTGFAHIKMNNGVAIVNNYRIHNNKIL